MIEDVLAGRCRGLFGSESEMREEFSVDLKKIEEVVRFEERENERVKSYSEILFGFFKARPKEIIQRQLIASAVVDMV